MTRRVANTKARCGCLCFQVRAAPNRVRPTPRRASSRVSAELAALTPLSVDSLARNEHTLGLTSFRVTVNSRVVLYREGAVIKLVDVGLTFVGTV